VQVQDDLLQIQFSDIKSSTDRNFKNMHWWVFPYPPRVYELTVPNGKEGMEYREGSLPRNTVVLVMLPLLYFIQFQSLLLIYHQFHQVKCIPLEPPIIFDENSSYSTRTPSYFVSIPTFPCGLLNISFVIATLMMEYITIIGN